MGEGITDQPSPAGALVQLVSVTRRYEVVTTTADALPVLRDINLSAQRGESLAITGPSGSGKTTLLNIIGALDQPSSGLVKIDGSDLTTLSESELAALRNRRIGFVFQSHHLLPQCTALENVLVPLLADKDRKRREDGHIRGRRLLERVGLADRMDHRPGQLSGGEKQRVALVRALINQPVLLLADEPTGSLDQQRADELAQLLIDLNREENVTLIVVTHAPTLARRMGRVLVLENGTLTDRGGAS